MLRENTEFFPGGGGGAGLAVESRNPTILDCRQFACLQTVCLPAGSFDFLLKKKKMSFYSNEIVGSLAIILPAGRLLICRQAGF